MRVNNSQHKVVILQYRLLHYRVQLFEKLRVACTERGVEFRLVHGQPTATELKKRDVGTLEWADIISNRYFNVRGRDILWQPYPAKHRDASLVIMMQENRLLSNYPWLFWRNATKAKIGYWGHGRNFQTNAPTGLREKWKQALVGRVDWWFAYTQMTREILLGDGYQDERITVLDNAIDNESFQAELAVVTEGELAKLRMSIGVSTQDGNAAPIGLFCGSLYPDKRIDFMIASADRIRTIVPGFRLVIVGDGPSAADVQAAATSRPWLHWVGVKKGREKAAWFKLATVIFNPGAVGLHVLDAFAAGVPMATTADARHGPEIAYLVDGLNGIKTPGHVEDYSNAVLKMLTDSARYAAIRSAGLAAANRYTLDNMVERFVTGIEGCLATPKK
jgi:glycosyltransferase involved in cell wall biosynthesis